MPAVALSTALPIDSFPHAPLGPECTLLYLPRHASVPRFPSLPILSLSTQQPIIFNSTADRPPPLYAPAIPKPKPNTLWPPSFVCGPSLNLVSKLVCLPLSRIPSDAFCQQSIPSNATLPCSRQRILLLTLSARPPNPPCTSKNSAVTKHPTAAPAQNPVHPALYYSRCPLFPPRNSTPPVRKHRLARALACPTHFHSRPARFPPPFRRPAAYKFDAPHRARSLLPLNKALLQHNSAMCRTVTSRGIGAQGSRRVGDARLLDVIRTMAGHGCWLRFARHLKAAGLPAPGGACSQVGWSVGWLVGGLAQTRLVGRGLAQTRLVGQGRGSNSSCACSTAGGACSPGRTEARTAVAAHT